MLDNVLIATRQARLHSGRHYIKDKLMASHPGLVVELVPMVTRGDDSIPLAKVGGKAIVKELEVALWKIAPMCRSFNEDVPVEFPQGLGLVTICERRSRDAFIQHLTVWMRYRQAVSSGRPVYVAVPAG